MNKTTPKSSLIPADAGSRRASRLDVARRLLPGIGLCVAITVISYGLQIVEERALGHPYVEALVLAI
jgi:hypothetical protein